MFIEMCIPCQLDRVAFLGNIEQLLSAMKFSCRDFDQDRLLCKKRRHMASAKPQHYPHRILAGWRSDCVEFAIMAIAPVGAPKTAETSAWMDVLARCLLGFVRGQMTMEQTVQQYLTCKKKGNWVSPDEA
jgi:hypothetical protein